MLNKFKFYIYIAIGVIAIGLSIRCFTYKSLNYQYEAYYYGHNAVTDIAKATAITSKNTKEIASIVQFSFGSILLVSGLGFIAIGLTSPLPKKDQEDDNDNFYDLP